MPIEYLLPTSTSQMDHDFSSTWILNRQFSELEKLDEVRLVTMETTHKRPHHHFVWAKQHYKPKTFPWETMFYGFQRPTIPSLANWKDNDLVLTIFNIVFQTILHSSKQWTSLMLTQFWLTSTNSSRTSCRWRFLRTGISTGGEEGAMDWRTWGFTTKTWGYITKILHF